MMMMMQMAQQQAAQQAAQMQMMLAMAKDAGKAGSGTEALELGMKLASILGAKGADGEAINWGDTLQQVMQTIQTGIAGAVALKQAGVGAVPPPGFEPPEEEGVPPFENGAAMPAQEGPPPYAPTPLHS